MKKGISIGKYHLFKGKNIKGFSFFLIAAFIFLVLTKFSDTYSEKLKIKVELDGLKEEIALVEDSTYYVDVLVKSRGFSLVPFLFKKPKPIRLDVKKDIKKNSNTYQWNVLQQLHVIENSLGRNFELVNVEPDTLFFNFNVLESRMLPVKLNTALSFVPGFDIKDKIILSQDSVKLVGAKDDFKAISYVETEILRLKDIQDDIRGNLKLIKPEISNVKIFPSEIKIEANVERFTEGVLTVPVTLKNVPSASRVNYFPKEVELTYYVDLENYKTIDIEDFKVECDYNALSIENQNFLIPEIVEQPKSVKSVRLKQNRIEIIVLER